ncbi:MAG: permease-like cell division protein FtsX [Patescibacteria group bacterium]|nr:permease-like cell division protein FtsX [bacterium]MDZ4240883.1 permease-like cell division protein FtsX [Patescibacteria group bacterium]
MFLTTTKRILKSGFFSFWRNGFVSLSSVLIMVVTLSVIGSIIFLGAILDSTLTEIRNKVDVNVYFVTSAAEDDILSIKARLETLPEVNEVTYVSREQALEDFKERHKDDQFTIQALEELTDNPLGAVLNIRASEPSQYEGVAKFLEGDNILSKEGSPIVDKINYFQNKAAIDRLTKIINSADKLGFVLTIVLVIISVLITFNTIRLVIYISREEIGVMRLVGASGSYVRGPFVVGGIIYGFVAAIITLILFYPITFWLGDITAGFFIGLNVFEYYLSNFGQMFLVIVTSGIVIGALSSYLAVMRYLNK